MEQLWIDGEEASLVGTPWIDFTDSTDLLDAVTMTGDFSRGGQVAEFSTVVGLSPLAYAFHSVIEVPPHIASMATISRGTSVFSPYVAIVPPGTWVSVVPEPRAMALGWVLGSLLVVRRWAGCRREDSPGSRHVRA